jgi:hypothetical protein
MATVAPSAPPDTRAAPHAREPLVWHALSAATMAAMVLVTLPVWAAAVAVAVFATGLVRCALQAVGRRPRAPYVRLGVCCLAMLAMLLPLGGPSVPAAGSMAGSGSMGSGSMGSADPGLPTLLLAGLLVCLAVSGVARGVLASAAPRSRAVGLAEALLAAATATMLVGAL